MLCTKARITASHTDEDGTLVIDGLDVIDIGLVTDDHPAGIDADGLLHIQAPRPSLLALSFGFGPANGNGKAHA